MIETASFTLANGLRVVHHADTSTAKVAVDILYNVGAKDENPQLTGMAHLFEHLMFGGSVNIADFDREVELAGGWNNAWTSNDFTNFYTVVPAVNAETAFWVESDRMLQLAFSDKALEVQRQVVVEEFKQTTLNRPYGDVDSLMRSLLYKKHPYRWQTIGLSTDHILAVTQDNVRNFFYSHYAPNNAVLSVAGNITLERTRELAEKWFGPVPRRHIAPRNYPQEPPVTSPRTLNVTRPVPATLLSVLYPMPGYSHPLFPAADILTDIFANGESSRFHRELIMEDSVFTEADASILGSEEPGYLLMGGMLVDGNADTVTTARQQLALQAQRICETPPSQEELERALNKFESNFVRSTTNYLSKARKIAIAEMHGENINDILLRYKALSVEDIQRAAKEILDPSRACTLIYLPEEKA